VFSGNSGDGDGDGAVHWAREGVSNMLVPHCQGVFDRGGGDSTGMGEGGVGWHLPIVSLLSSGLMMVISLGMTPSELSL
jgi:hypothetical protein